jgi:H(+)-translocating pyrophosphatase
MDDPIADMIL